MIFTFPALPSKLIALFLHSLSKTFSHIFLLSLHCKIISGKFKQRRRRHRREKKMQAQLLSEKPMSIFHPFSLFWEQGMSSQRSQGLVSLFICYIHSLLSSIGRVRQLRICLKSLIKSCLCSTTLSLLMSCINL